MFKLMGKKTITILHANIDLVKWNYDISLVDKLGYGLSYSWKCVGEELVALYDKATTSDPIIVSMSFLILCILGNFHAFVVVCCLFSKLSFSKSSFRNAIRVSNGLDSHQD